MNAIAIGPFVFASEQFAAILGILTFAIATSLGAKARQLGGFVWSEAGFVLVVGSLLGAIGAAVVADRTLGGLCDFIEAEAPSTDDVETAGARAGRWADPSIVAVYGTTDPLN